MLNDLFANPFMYWVGMDFGGADEAGTDEFNSFYDGTHLGEVVKNNAGFVQAHRYELESPDPRGDHGPTSLAIYEIEDEASLKAYLDRQDAPRMPGAASPFTPSPKAWKDHAAMRWRLMWRRISESTEAVGMPDSIFIVGINPPAGAGAEEIAEFNDFYTNTHVNELLAGGRFKRGSRFELAHELSHPPPGCPRYLALYEIYDVPEGTPPPSTAGRRTGGLSAGPVVWQRHTTPWRLTYRRRKPD